jgi:hypothetical protein
MQRIASILTGFSLAVLFFVASAHAQSGQRMTANIPFEFTVGNISLPAGQYEFLSIGDNIVQVRGADRRSRFTLSSASPALIQANGLPEKSMLKFATVDGRHVLVQIWNELAANSNEFPYGHTSVELAKHATIDGTVTDRR